MRALCSSYKVQRLLVGHDVCFDQFINYKERTCLKDCSNPCIC
jgi:hypothetical protein